MHVIHLRGPWECHSAADVISANVTTAGAVTGLANAVNHTSSRLQLPLTVPPESLPLHLGQLLLSRKFGRPTGIEPGDTLELVLRSLPLVTQLQLNETALGTWEPTNHPFAERLEWTVNVTQFLRERNHLQLAITVQRPASQQPASTAGTNLPPLVWPEVSLTIRPAGS